MGTIYQEAVESWYGNTSWAEHSSMELTSGYARAGRLQFGSLSSGNSIESLTFKFNKTNSGGGGYLHFYATGNAALLGNQTTSMIDLGLMPIFGSGTGWKTLAVPASMLEALSQFAGTWYLVMTCSVYVTFYGQYSTNSPRFEGTYSDGSMYLSDGGVQKISVSYFNDGGVWKQSIASINDGGVWKQGLA